MKSATGFPNRCNMKQKNDIDYYLQKITSRGIKTVICEQMMKLKAHIRQSYSDRFLLI